MRLYSLLNGEGLYIADPHAAVAASRRSASMRVLASCKRSFFWYCKGLRAVIDRKW